MPTAGYANPPARVIEVSISAQPMATALQDFARQIGKQVIFYSDQARNLRATPVRGRLREEEALRRLLGNSRLTYVYLNERTIAVGRQDTFGRLARPRTAERRSPPAPAEARADNVIVVTGRLLDAELSTDAKRDAPKVEDVITADQTSQLPDKNVAETLARIPGVSLIRNGETGDGAFVSVRGLDSALSTIQFDGVNSAQANSGNRSIPLEGITADNVREIRVAKSLLPSDEGSGIGGIVNIITRRPLQDGRDLVTADVSARYGEFANKLGFDGGASITRIFNDEVGVNLSASFRRRFIQTYNIDAINSYLSYIDTVTDAQGRVLSGAQLNDLGLNAPGDWRRYTPGEFSPEQISYEQQSYQIVEQTRDTLSLSGAIEWRPSGDTQISFSGRFSANRTDGVEWMVGFDEDGGDMALSGDRLVATWLDLELDYEAQNEQSQDINAVALLEGVTQADRFKLDWQVSYAHARSENPQTDIVFNSATRFDRGRTPALSYHPYTFADRYFPVPNAAVLGDPAFSAALQNIPDAVELTSWRAFELTQRNDRYAGKFDLSYDLDPSLLGGVLTRIEAGGKAERSDRYTFFDYLQSNAARLDLDGTYNESGSGTALGRTLREFSSLGLGAIDFDPIGSPLAPLGLTSIPAFDRKAWNSFADRFRDTFIAASAPYFSRDFFRSREDIYAGYAQLQFASHGFSMVAGGRAEAYRASFTTPMSFAGTLRLRSPDQPERVLDLGVPGATLDRVTTRASNVEFLPRLSAVFDLSDIFKVRAGVGQSIARPTYSQLGNAVSVSLSFAGEDPAGGVILPGVSDVAGAVVAGGLKASEVRDVAISLSSGNPGLKNAKSTNLDLSVEWYPRRGTAVSIGAFYKSIDNFIFLGAESTEATLEPEFVESFLSPEAARLLAPLGGVAGLAADSFNPTLTISRPVNGRKAILKGVELSAQHRFDWLPGKLGHLGFYGNATFTDSEATFVVRNSLAADEALVVLGFYRPGQAVVRRSAFFRAPTVSGAASLFYDDGRLDWAISATYQSASFDAPDDFGLDQYTAGYNQIDLFVGYAIPAFTGEIKAFVEVADILDGGMKPTDVQTVGRHPTSWDESSFNGREFRFGLRTRF